MANRTITFLIEGRDKLSAAVNAAKNSLNSLKGATGKINALQRALANSQNLQKMIGDYRNLQRAIQASQSARAQELLKASRAAAAQSQAVKQLEKMRDAMKNLQKYQRGERANLDVDKASVARLKSALQQHGATMNTDAARIMREQIRAAEREIKSREKSLNQIMRGAKLDLSAQAAAVKSFGDAFTTANSKAQQLRATLASQQSQLAALRSAMNAQGLTGTLAGHEMRLRSEIQQTINAINRETEAFNRRNHAAQNFSRAQQDMANAYSNMQNAEQTAETLMSPFTAATKVAMNFEREMSKVKALTQMRNIRAGNTAAVESEMSSLKELAERLGATTEFTSAEAAQGMQKYAMAGWTAEQIEAIMTATVDFASIAGDHNLMRTADVLSDDLTAFGLKAGQAYKLSSGKVVEASKYFTDAVSYAITQANLDREFFHESWKYNAPVAHAMNLSLGEAIAQNMVLANAGIKGSMSGTSLRQFWVRLSAPPKTAQKSLEEMGMLASDATKKIIETQEALREAGADPNSDLFDKIAALEKYYQEGKAAGRDMTGWLKQLTGQTALSGIMSLFDLGKLDEARRYKMEIDTGWVEGWTGEVAKITRENSATEVEYLKSAWDALAKSIGDAFLPSVSAAAKSLTNLVNSANDFVKNNQSLVQWLGAFAAGLSAIILLGAGLAGLSAAFSFISSGLVMAVGAVRGFLAVLSVLRTAIMATGAAAAIAGAIGAAPIWLIVAAVAAVIAIVAYATGCFDGLGEAIAAAWNHPQGAVTGFCELVKSSIDSAVDYVMARWMTLKSALEHPIEATINFIDHGSVVGGNVINGTESVKNWRRSVDFVKNHKTFFDNLPGHSAGSGGGGGSFGEPINVQSATIQAAQVDLPKIETPQVEIPQVEIPTIETPQVQIPEVQIPPVDTSLVQSSLDVVSFSSQNLAMNLAATSPATQALAMSAQTASAGANALGLSATTATGGVNALSASAAASTGSISSMAGASSSAAGSISGLGAAAASAISSLLSAGASAAGAIFSAISAAGSAGAKVASNASGGIYQQGAFLTTFAETSPEAAIPIDSSARAKSLWFETGNLLGMFDGGGNSNSVTVNVNMTFNGEKPADTNWVDDVREVFAELANEYFADRRRVSYA